MFYNATTRLGRTDLFVGSLNKPSKCTCCTKAKERFSDGTSQSAILVDKTVICIQGGQI